MKQFEELCNEVDEIVEKEKREMKYNPRQHEEDLLTLIKEQEQTIEETNALLASQIEDLRMLEEYLTVVEKRKHSWK